ncbi:hypothetical protein [Blautia schinkii]|uniref:hypothetical protein n=1 Tax=Blautia schinkii TaxID=180164 RepID=UPI001570AE3E|nr:hypothetical protein [Blautia schinkii]NSK34306.1 hypothetical protein [Blautia schinkii]NSK66135.1 hypothetical protein [Blautia schinkii]
MRRVEEVIYVVPEERKAFLEKQLNPSEKTRKFMWQHGIRNQFFYELEEFILMTFEYVGDDFYKDMAVLSATLEDEGYFIKERRRDVAPEQLKTTNWWAPLKILGSNFVQTPFSSEEDVEADELASEAKNGCIHDEDDIRSNIAFDADDWSESIHF